MKVTQMQLLLLTVFVLPSADAMTSLMLSRGASGLLSADADDRSFWDAAWAAAEARLLELEAMASSGRGAVSALQFSAPVVARNVTSHPKRKVSEVSRLTASVKLNPKGPEDLLPALAMLKAMYENCKDQIKALNEREQQSKQRFAKQEADHNAKLQEIEARFANSTLSEEYRTNETQTEERFWKYWQRVRARENRQFHTSLKIQHATMQRVKTMIDLYEKALSGEVDPASMRDEIARASGGMPTHVAFIQRAWSDVASFCRETLVEVRNARHEADDADATDP